MDSKHIYNTYCAIYKTSIALFLIFSHSYANSVNTPLDAQVPTDR